MKRVKIITLVAPNGIYQRQVRQATGYRPSAGSRFAVVRTSETAPWVAVHVASGGQVDSLFPAVARTLTLADKLAVCAEWEAMTHADWSAFDGLPAVTEATTAAPRLPSPTVSQRATITEMRNAAYRLIPSA